MLRPEQAFQIQVAQYLAAVLPPEVAWTAFPAGGGGKRRGAFLKAMGLRPGWPDIQIVYCGVYHGIELKARKGRHSDAQRAVLGHLAEDGARVTTCRDLDTVGAALRAWGIPTRHHKMLASGGVKTEFEEMYPVRC
jgi:hypothetical protein